MFNPEKYDALVALLTAIPKQTEPSGRTRKNNGFVNDLLAELKIEPGEHISTEWLETKIKERGDHTRWNLNPAARDKFGLAKALGDNLGPAGLGLRPVRLGKKKKLRHYLMPTKLPILSGDTVIQEAEYPLPIWADRSHW